jgi:hypothetical protein
MTQWDYLRADIIFGKLGSQACYVDGDPASIPPFQGALAEKPDRDRLFYDLGSRGWELVAVTARDDTWEYMFKRPRRTTNHAE